MHYKIYQQNNTTKTIKKTGRHLAGVNNADCRLGRLDDKQGELSESKTLVVEV